MEHIKQLNYDAIVNSDRSNSQKIADLVDLLQRRSGRSTRSIDSYIQQLFKEGKIKVVDHFFGNNSSGSVKASQNLFFRIKDRLEREHPSRDGEVFKYNYPKLTIEYLLYKQDLAFVQMALKKIEQLKKPDKLTQQRNKKEMWSDDSIKDFKFH